MTSRQEQQPAPYWHILRPVKGESVPARLLVFQIEPLVRMADASTHEHTFRLGAGVCYWLTDGEVVDQETTVFHRREEWFRWVQDRSDRQRTTWVYSYGLVYGLTLLDFWRTAVGKTESLVSAVLSDPPSIVLTRQGRCVRRYVDVANYCRDGLRSMLRNSGLTPPSPLSHGSSTLQVHDYCLSKTLAVGDYLCQAISLVRRNRLSAWQSTAASLSFATFRHSFSSTGLFIHRDAEALKLERAGLYGGRVQQWAIGSVKTTVSIVDCNSLYPYVMRDYPHPVKFRSHQWGGTVRELHQAVRGYWCCAAVRLRRSALDLPRRVGPNLYWDGAAGSRYLAGSELAAAVSCGSVRTVHSLSRYDFGSPFESFVDSLFGLKLSLTKEGKHGQASLTKTVLNSLHGKFAQQGRRWMQAKGKIGGPPWTTWWGRSPVDGSWVPYRNLGGRVEWCQKTGEWRHSFPALSSSIASAARTELARARDVAGVGETLYCDTDSLHVEQLAYDRLAASDILHPTRLGGWKTVTTGTDAHYWGLKHYRVGTKYCCCCLTPSAWEVADGRYRDAARMHFGRLLEDGLPDAVYYRERTVKVRDVDSGERMEVIDYEDVA